MTDPMDKYYYGRRPTQPMMPNFRNVHKQEMDFQRGYMVFFGADREVGVISKVILNWVFRLKE